MKQQVNLFQPMFRRQRLVLSSTALAQSVGVACAGLMLLYAWAAWHVSALGADVDGLAAQRDAARARLVEIDEQVPQRRPSRVLATELAAAEVGLARHRELVSALSERSVGNPDGFSGYFSGLARRRIDGLWLTGVEIAAGGEHLAIGGRALDPALVPKLVQRLAEEPAYAGVEFASLVIGRPAEEHGRVDFELHTEAPAVPEAGR